MSTWRRKALELLPEIKVVIERSESPRMLWSEIGFEFNKSVDENNIDLIRRILIYSVWCTSDHAGDINSETHQAVYCGFLENIARNKKHWSFFNKWFTRSQFEKYKGSFRYILNDKEYKKLENIFFER